MDNKNTENPHSNSPEGSPMIGITCQINADKILSGTIIKLKNGIASKLTKGERIETALNCHSTIGNKAINTRHCVCNNTEKAYFK